jgi:ABC-type lipoprotein export system ATPase subunit
MTTAPEIQKTVLPNERWDAVACRGVKKHFGEGDARVEVLRGVDFGATLGEMTFLVGPSGCGKTTLISVIAGLLDPSEGQLDVLGHGHGELNGRARVLFRRRNLGFVFQQYNLLPSLTALETPTRILILPLPSATNQDCAVSGTICDCAPKCKRHNNIKILNILLSNH